MGISFHNEDVDLPNFDFIETNEWLSNVIKHFEFEVGEISIIFTSDEYLLNINRDYLKHDYLTDIISFNYSSKNTISGDLFISVDRVMENSKLFSPSFIFELHRVMVHGVLHLLGFDDQSEQEIEIMRFQEDKWLHVYFA